MASEKNGAGGKAEARAAIAKALKRKNVVVAVKRTALAKILRKMGIGRS